MTLRIYMKKVKPRTITILIMPSSLEQEIKAALHTRHGIIVRARSQNAICNFYLRLITSSAAHTSRAESSSALARFSSLSHVLPSSVSLLFSTNETSVGFHK